MATETIAAPTLTAKDFATDQEVRWCPGCGDYSILAQVQKIMPGIGVPKENIVIISGIGCSSRFPYYMNTFGMHSIHGRATAIASGLKATRPELSVWIVTGDGDGLSIGGNHTIHLLRRNFDVNIMLFNNQIYGLTKGQYSPTTEKGKVTKTSPYGSIDHPFNPGKLAIGAGATFIAKTIDSDPKHMTDMMIEADKHIGISFVEVYQNCVIFNDKAHDVYTNRQTRDENTLYVEHGKKMIFGKEKNKGIKLNGFNLEVVTIGENGVGEDDLVTHDVHNPILAFQLLEYSNPPEFPMVIGVLYQQEKSTYEEDLEKCRVAVIDKKGAKSLSDIIFDDEVWSVK